MLSFRLCLLLASAPLLLSVLACSDPEKPPAEAAYSVGLIRDRDPMPPNTLDCPAGVNRMVPSQLSAMNATLILNATTSQTALEGMATVVDGDNGEVQCTVQETGEGTYTVNALVDTVDKFDLEVQISGAFGTGRLQMIEGGIQFSSSSCNINVDTRSSDNTPFIEPGTAKLTYFCRPFVTEAQQSCEAQGTIYLTNCRE